MDVNRYVAGRLLRRALTIRRRFASAIFRLWFRAILGRGLESRAMQYHRGLIVPRKSMNTFSPLSFVTALAPR
jgi:hypothetical protein